MRRGIALLTGLLVLVPASAASAETLGVARARHAALVAERATAAQVVHQSQELRGTGSRVDSCRRIAPAAVRCATHSTYEQRHGEDGAVLIDKLMTRGVVTVTSSAGRLSVRYRAR